MGVSRPIKAVSNEYINNPSHVLNHILNTLIHPQLGIKRYAVRPAVEIMKPARSTEIFTFITSIFPTCNVPFCSLFFNCDKKDGCSSIHGSVWVVLKTPKQRLKIKVLMNVVNTCNVQVSRTKVGGEQESVKQHVP